MNASPFDILLHNYRTLIERVDTHILKVEEQFSNQIACKKGCDSCCRFLSLFPVEAFSISEACTRLTEDMKQKIADRLKHHPDSCPLLIDNVCVIYPARPIICRTHGFPIYIEKDNDVSIDFCPKNFKQITAFPKEVLLSIEPLNETLIAVNQHFLENITTDERLPDRVPVSQAIYMISAEQL